MNKIYWALKWLLMLKSCKPLQTKKPLGSWGIRTRVFVKFDSWSSSVCKLCIWPLISQMETIVLFNLKILSHQEVTHVSRSSVQNLLVFLLLPGGPRLGPRGRVQTGSRPPSCSTCRSRPDPDPHHQRERPTQHQGRLSLPGIYNVLPMIKSSPLGI